MIIKVTTGRDCNGVLRCYKIERSDGSIWYAPLDPANTDYQEYLKWVAEGNEAEEVEHNV